MKMKRITTIIAALDATTMRVISCDAVMRCFMA